MSMSYPDGLAAMIKYRIDMEILAKSLVIKGIQTFSDHDEAVKVLSELSLSLVDSGLYGISLEIVEDK